MLKVVILNGNHLCHNPRVFKEAAALAAAGFDVEVLGAWFDEALARRDLDLSRGQAFRYTPVFELFRESGRRSFAGTALRARNWAGIRAVRWMGLETAAALGYGLDTMLREAKRRKADLFIAHSEPTLWVAAKLAEAGKKIGVDMEDWFSEDYIWSGRPRRLLRRLETTILSSAAHSTCTSQAMSSELAAVYRCRRPTVIYNAFAWGDRKNTDGLIKDRRNLSVRSIHWFSQTVGPGRGLDDLFAALPFIKGEVEIHVRGTAAGTNRTWFEGSIPAAWRTRIFLHPIVPNDELLSRIAEHDIGAALERDEPRNKDLTVSNKILQYLQAGLAVAATSTAGQREVAAAAAGAVCLYTAGNPIELANRLNVFLTTKKALAQAKDAALQASRTAFAWENIAPILVASVERACHKKAVAV